jgi:hypothetical protein
LSVTFYVFFGIITVLLIAFIWSLQNPKRLAAHRSARALPEDPSRSAVTYSPQIRQALAKTDYEFVSSRVSREALRRMRRERRRVALAYLPALRQEFEGLVCISRVIAALSPEIGVAQEFDRLRLTVNFRWRYRILWLSLWAGYATLPQMNYLSNLISGYSVRLEEAMREMGERAALVAEMVSSPDRRRVHPV